MTICLAGALNRLLISVFSAPRKVKISMSGPLLPICCPMIHNPVLCLTCLCFFITDPDSDRRQQAKDMTEGDIKILVGYNGLMGIVGKPAIPHYWSVDRVIETPFFHEYMSRNTFQLLMSKLHFNDDSQNPKRGQAGHDPLAKIRNIVNALQWSFGKSYIPLRDLGLDEMGCKFHGVCIFRQYNKSKPDKYHIKFYGVAESVSGYVCMFEIYTGKGPPSATDMMAKRWGADKDSCCRFGRVDTV